MHKRLLTILVCVLAISLSALAAAKKKKAPAPTAPDKAYLQKILDGWSTLATPPTWPSTTIRASTCSLISRR